MMKRIISFALCAALVSSCGLRIGSGVTDFGVGGIKNNLKNIRGQNAVKKGDASAKLTRAALNQIPQQLIRAEFSKYGLSAVMTKVADRDGNATYLSPSQQTITLQAGQLRMTRGLPFDLLETDLRKQNDRVYRYLNAANTLSELRVACRLTDRSSETIEIVERNYQTVKIQETCSGSGISFDNTYWADARGVVWKSNQFIGPNHGSVTIEKLN